jgi:FtsZ-binding cell division protein ZapB
MNALTGMEKFSHLEDKIYLTIEFAKKMRDEKEKLERAADALKQDAANAIAEKKAIEEKLDALLSERDSIQLKVEAMLDAITMIDSDVAEAMGK